MLLGWPLLAAVTLASQSPEAPPSQRRQDRPALPAKSVTATHAAQQPVIDGRDDDTAFTNNIGGFNYKQFRSNVVFRWEYRPGSALFVVWSQRRQGSTGIEGTRSFGGDMNDLFNLRPDNRFLVKLSYWFNR